MRCCRATHRCDSVAAMQPTAPVDVSVIIVERQSVLKIPVSALFRVGDAWTVFTVHDGQARRTAVIIGERNAIEAELLSGLGEGEQVVVHPGETVEDGVAVTPR